jgi:hypothetical protein
MSGELHRKTQKLFTELFFTESNDIYRGRRLVPKRDPDSVQLRKEFYEKLINNNEFKQLVEKTGMPLIPSREAIASLKPYFFDKRIDTDELEYGNSNLETGIIRALGINFSMMGRAEYEDEIWRIIYEILGRLSRKSQPYDAYGDVKPITETRGPRLGKGLRGLDMHPRKKWLAKFGEGGEYVPGRNPWENIDVALATRPPTYSQFGRITPEPYAAMGAVAPGDAVAPARDAVAPARDADAPARDAVAPARDADDDDWAEFGGRRRKSRKSRKPRKSSNKKRKQRKTKRRRQ